MLTLWEERLFAITIEFRQLTTTSVDGEQTFRHDIFRIRNTELTFREKAVYVLFCKLRLFLILNFLYRLFSKQEDTLRESGPFPFSACCLRHGHWFALVSFKLDGHF